MEKDQQQKDVGQSQSAKDCNKEFIYAAQQKVLCYHGNFVYEARVIKVDWKNPKECFDKNLTETELKELEERYKNIAKVPAYFIHYYGWNKNWDEWVLAERIREYTEENLKQLATPRSGKTKILPERNKKPMSTADANNIENQMNGGTKRRRNQRQNYTQEKQFTIFNEDYQIPISDLLKRCLVDDYFRCHKEQKIVKLPCNLTVNTLFDEYVQNRWHLEDRNESPLEPIIKCEQLCFANDLINADLKYDGYLGPKFRKCCYRELVQGLKTYFNHILGTQLLYQIERIQYCDLFNLDSNNENSKMVNTANNPETESLLSSVVPKSMRSHHQKNALESCTETNKPQTNKSKTVHPLLATTTTPAKPEPSQIYPPIHLLRMFTRLGTFLRYFNADKGMLQMLNIVFEDFLKYIEENHEQYLSSGEKSPIQYINVTADYMQRTSNRQSMMVMSMDEDSNHGKTK